MVSKDSIDPGLSHGWVYFVGKPFDCTVTCIPSKGTGFMGRVQIHACKMLSVMWKPRQQLLQKSIVQLMQLLYLSCHFSTRLDGIKNTRFLTRRMMFVECQFQRREKARVTRLYHGSGWWKEWETMKTKPYKIVSPSADWDAHTDIVDRS
jgi:hypothetical protein